MEQQRKIQRVTQGATLVDLLDRILDKGLVVAGDIVVQLADIELLTIKIRLIICSVDKAQEIGMDWWRHDTFLSSAARPALKQGTPKLFEKQKNKLSTRAKRAQKGRPQSRTSSLRGKK